MPVGYVIGGNKLSKLNLRLSYKNACILKHALKDEIKMKEDILSDFDGIKNKSYEEFDEIDVYACEHFDRETFIKELD
jgi:hypothetical protein